jgi:hypothetical protein
MIRVTMPERHALDHSPDIVHQLRLSSQASPNPSHEADVLIGEVALAPEMVEPAVGVTVEDPDEHLVTEEISGRRGPGGRKGDHVAEKRTLESVQTGIGMENVFDEPAPRRRGAAETDHPEPAAAVADGSSAADSCPWAGGDAARADGASAAGLVN